MIRRWGRALLFVAVGLLLFGCAGTKNDVSTSASSSRTDGSTGTATARPVIAEVMVTDKGFTVWEAIDDHYASWAVILENPNAELIAKDVTLTISFKANGVLIGEPEVETIPVLRSGRTGWARLQKGGVLSPGGYSFMQSVGKTPTELEVNVQVGEWVPIASLPSGSVEVEQVRVVADPNDIPSEIVTAQARSSFTQSQRDVASVAVFRDAAGEIVGGARDVVADLPPGGLTPIEIRDRERLAGVTTADVFLVPGV